MLKNGRNIMGLVFIDPRTRQREGTWRFGHCNCPDNTIKCRVKKAIAIKQRRPFLNRYEGLDLPPIQYRPMRKKSKSYILPSVLSAFDKLYFSILWPKELEGLDWFFLVCRTSWSNCWLKKQIKNYRGYIKVSVYYLFQREDVALNSMNQLTYWVLEFQS